MTLKDKFQQWFINDEEDEHYKGMVELVSIEHEKLADEHAIGFADWLDTLKPHQRVSFWSKNGEYKGKFDMDNEQLLEIYKKENNL